MTTDPAAGAQADPAAGAQPQGAAPVADPWTDPATARTEIEKLRRESAGYRTKVRELEPLAAQATAATEAQKTEAQRLADQLAAAQRTAADAQASLMRMQVATSKGLPAELAGRLQGATEAELAEDADKLSALLGGSAAGAQQQPGARPQVDLRQGARGNAPVNGTPDMNDWLRGVARRGGRIPNN